MDVLDGLRVLDLTEGVAGPIAGMFLADFGAEVIKIEPPAGDPHRPLAGFAVFNRGKKSVTVDPGDPGRLAWLYAQIAGADVLLTAGPSQLARYGLDSSRLLAEHGRLVLTEVPPFLPGDLTPWAGGAESAEMLNAMGGLSARQSSFSGEPVDLVAPVVLYCQGVWAAVCTVAALVERHGSNAGQHVIVTGANGLQVINFNNYVVDPNHADPNTAVGPRGRHPTLGAFQGSDGKWLVCGALGGKLEEVAVRTLGLGKTMLEDPRMHGGQVWAMFLPDNIDWAQKLVAEAFRTRPAAEWVELLDQVDVPCGLLADRDEWLDHPQVVATGMRAEVDDPERGHVVMPGIMINLTASPGSVHGPAPRLGEHNDTAPGWEAQPAAAALPPMRPGPLAGYTILNVGSFIATPYSGSLLAELGADVIKVEPPSGDGFRIMGWSGNRGLRSAALDLHTPDGVAAFHELARHADAVVDGLRPGTTSRLGIDYDSLAKINAGIITLSLTGYGEGGPLSRKGGVDTVMTGISGIMSAQGGDGVPVNNTVAVVDATTGAVSALAVVLALLHRLRTGQGQRIWDSLLGTVTYLQSGEIVRYEGRPASRTGGNDFKGSSAFDRLYATAGGWIRIQAPAGASAEAAAEQALGINVRGFSDSAATEIIAGALGTLPRAEALAALNEASLPAAPVLKVSEAIRQPHLVESEFVHVRFGPGGGVICDTGRHALFSRTPRTGIKLPPGVGQHTEEALSAAGVPAETISSLFGEGIAVNGSPMANASVISYR